MQFPGFDLTGKVALVTGGSRGLGRGIALGLANAGADVAICSRTEETVRNAAAEIEDLGRKSLPIKADVSKVADINRMVAEVMDEFGHIDILVNAAGLNIRMPAVQYTEEQWDFILGANLKGTFFCCQAVAKVMIKPEGTLQNKGKIINIGSLTSGIGLPTVAPYAASKGGVLQLTKTLAIEWAKYNINVNAIGPGFHQTDLTQPLFSNPEWTERLLTMLPIERPGTSEDLIGAAVFLASDASDYMTGQIIYVDGGFLAGWKEFSKDI